MKLLNTILSVGVLVPTMWSCASTDADIRAARDLTARVVPSLVEKINYIKIDNDSVDCFTLKQNGSKIEIGGNNAGAMAMGLNYYLKNYCLTEVSWFREDPVELPDTLPIVADIVSVDAKVPYRFFLNYCTSGYSMPWWKWEDWERFIDWMAMNGVNLPLATTGQESVWYEVWKKIGLTDEEIFNYFTGPAHLPWHRMCNLDGWQGPLPKSWLKNESELQKRIVNRERELSMTPVLPGFAGHVPAALKRIYPDANTTTVSQWGGFPDDYRCTYLSPTDSLFAQIQRIYLTEQNRMYGTDHIYGVDPFNEVDPPTWNPDSLKIISNDIYNSLTSVDPKAVWLQMAWILYADPEHWTTECAKAYITGVPEGRMMLLDYYCESVEEWKIFDSFWGQPYIWCYLGNFGGNSFLVSPFKNINARIDDVYENGGKNLVGIGSTLEGLDMNPYVYEYVLDRGWDLPVDFTESMNNIIDRRVGYIDNNARDAWNLLVDSIMVQPALCGQGPLINARPSLTGFSWWTTKPNVEYPLNQLDEAWSLMLNIERPARYTHAFDCVNLARQSMSNYFMLLRDDFTQAYNCKDINNLEEIGAQMKELLSDLTVLLNSCHATRLDKWIMDARYKGQTDDEKDYYERNARTIISIWGPSQDLNDYANRQWAELNETYYAVRWNKFIDMVIDAVKTSKKFDADGFFKWSREFENNWIEPIPLTVETDSSEDTYEVSRLMFDKWGGKASTHSHGHEGTTLPSLHHW